MRSIREQAPPALGVSEGKPMTIARTTGKKSTRRAVYGVVPTGLAAY